MEKVNHPALTMWDITTPSEEAAAVDAARGRAAEAVAVGRRSGNHRYASCGSRSRASGCSAGTTPIQPAVAASAPVRWQKPRCGSSVQRRTPIPSTSPGDGVGALIALLEQLRDAPPATEIQPGMTPMQQMAALQASTAMHLLHAGANMLLMQTGMLAAAAPAVMPMTR